MAVSRRIGSIAALGVLLFGLQSIRADEAADQPLKLRRSLGRTECTLIISNTKVSLSAELIVTLRIEGPAPLDVDMPQVISASTDWRGRANVAETTPLPDGRERRTQTFRFEPFQAGDRVPLQLTPIRVRAGNEIRDWALEWEPAPIHVFTTVSDADLGFARPVIAPDPLPRAAARSYRLWWWLSVLAVALVATGVGGYVWRRARRRPAVVSPLQRALAELQQLEALATFKPEHLARLAQLLRRFLEEQFAISATRLTTAEAIAAVRLARLLPEEFVDALHNILAQADLVKFAAAHVAPEAFGDLLAACRSILTSASVPTAQTVLPGEETPAS